MLPGFLSRAGVVVVAGALLVLGCGTESGSGGLPAGSAGAPAGSGGGGGAGAGRGGSAGGGGMTPGAAFLADYAAAVCAMYEPCCSADGLGYDAAGCTSWFRRVTAAYAGGEVDPDEAQACLAALAAAVEADPSRCSNVPSFDQATLRSSCLDAFRSAEREGSPLGGDCLLAADCASDERGPVICSSGNCLLQRRGTAGDGPCFLQGSGSGWEVAQCRAEDGLYCHRGENVCKAQVPGGEPCPYPGACLPSALCVGGGCRTLPGEGEECLNGVPGAGGYCRAGTACDRVTLVCGPGRAPGDACREPNECTSGLCNAGVCEASDYASRLNCTG